MFSRSDLIAIVLATYVTTMMMLMNPIVLLLFFFFSWLTLNASMCVVGSVNIIKSKKSSFTD